MLKSMIGFPAKEFYCGTVIKCSCILLLCCSVPFILYHLMECGWVRFVLNVFSTELVSLLIIGTIGVTKNERTFVLSKVPYLKKFVS